MKDIDVNEIKTFYEDVEVVWPENDKWHNYSQEKIKKFVNKYSYKNCQILNAGSGGNDYGLKNKMLHMDIAENKIKNMANYIVSNIEDIPFEREHFDMIICVGSVLNYCDATRAIMEMSRVLKRHGGLILEFENSYSFEFMKSDAYKSSASIVVTKYFGKPHRLWVYSYNYISKILQDNDLHIKKMNTFHILGSLAYYYNRDENHTAKYDKLDPILRHIPFIRMHSGNVILFAQKY